MSVEWLHVSNDQQNFQQGVALTLNNLDNHKVVDFQSKGQIINFQNFIGDTSIYKMYNVNVNLLYKLTYNASLDCGDWAKDLMCRFHTIEEIKI